VSLRVRVILALAIILSVAILALIPLRYVEEDVESAVKRPKSYLPGWERRDYIYHPLPNGCFRVEGIIEHPRPGPIPAGVTVPPPAEPLSDVELAELVDFLIREAGIYEYVKSFMASFRCVVDYHHHIIVISRYVVVEYNHTIVTDHEFIDAKAGYRVILAFHSLPGQIEGSSEIMPVPFWVEWRDVGISIKGYAISVTFEAYRENGEWKLHRWYPDFHVTIPLPGPVMNPDLAEDAVKAEKLAREWLESIGIKGAIVRFAHIEEDGVEKLAKVIAVDCRSADDWTLWRIVVDLKRERVIKDMSRPILYRGPPWRCLG